MSYEKNACIKYGARNWKYQEVDPSLMLLTVYYGQISKPTISIECAENK